MRPPSYVAVEVDVVGLPAWTLTGREQDDRVQIMHGPVVGWIHKAVLGPVLFRPDEQVFSVPCRACGSVMRASVSTDLGAKEAWEILAGVLCKTCQIMEAQAQSGVQTIGPRR